MALELLGKIAELQGQLVQLQSDFLELRQVQAETDRELAKRIANLERDEPSDPQ